MDRFILIFAAALLTFLPQGAWADVALPPVTDYVGAEVCGSCHREYYEAWAKTPHRNAVRDARTDPSIITAHFTEKVEGYAKEDIKYVIGGHWYERYMVEKDGEYYILPRIWSVASQRWEVRDAWSWLKKPYSTQCKGCHATRYDPDRRQQVEHQIGCEACHGPGALHAKSAGKAPILDLAKMEPNDRDMICASCHVRGKDKSGRYPFAVGFVPGRPLEDYYQPLAQLDDETPRETFLNTFRKWFRSLGQGHPPACDVCGIERPKGGVATMLTTTEQCKRCHSFAENDHTKSGHPGGIELECLDCHRQVSRIASNADDIHSPDLFRVHRNTGYEKEAATACKRCHDRY